MTKEGEKVDVKYGIARFEEKLAALPFNDELVDKSLLPPANLAQELDLWPAPESVKRIFVYEPDSVSDTLITLQKRIDLGCRNVLEWKRRNVEEYRRLETRLKSSFDIQENSWLPRIAFSSTFTFLTYRVNNRLGATLPVKLGATVLAGITSTLAVLPQSNRQQIIDVLERNVPDKVTDNFLKVHDGAVEGGVHLWTGLDSTFSRVNRRLDSFLESFNK